MQQNLNNQTPWTFFLYLAVNFSLFFNLLQSPMGLCPGFIHLAVKYWIPILGYIWHIFVWNQTLFSLLFLLRNPKWSVPSAFCMSSLSNRQSQNQPILSMVLRTLLGLLCTCRTETLLRKQLDICSHQTIKELSGLSRRWVLTIKAKILYIGTKQKWTRESM